MSPRATLRTFGLLFVAESTFFLGWSILGGASRLSLEGLPLDEPWFVFLILLLPIVLIARALHWPEKKVSSTVVSLL